VPLAELGRPRRRTNPAEPCRRGPPAQHRTPRPRCPTGTPSAAGESPSLTCDFRAFCSRTGLPASSTPQLERAWGRLARRKAPGAMGPTQRAEYADNPVPATLTTPRHNPTDAAV